MAQHWGRRGANVSENEGVRSECKKFGENSRQMARVSTICDEYCSFCYYKNFKILRRLWVKIVSWNPECENFFLWNSDSRAVESGIELSESEVPLTIVIRNPISTYKESGILYLDS